MKRLFYIITVIALGWVGLNYVAERTVDTTLQMIEDDVYTDWVKAAKECKVDTFNLADSINTEEGEGYAVR